MLTIRRETPEDYRAPARRNFHPQQLHPAGGIVLTAFYQLLINKTQRSPLLGRCVFCWGKGRITP